MLDVIFWVRESWGHMVIMDTSVHQESDQLTMRRQHIRKWFCLTSYCQQLYLISLSDQYLCHNDDQCTASTAQENSHIPDSLIRTTYWRECSDQKKEERC